MFEFHLPKNLNNKRLNLLSRKDIEPHDIFLDSLAKKKQVEFGMSERKIEVPLSEKLLKTFLFFIIILMLVLFGKTIELQIFNSKKYLVLAEENKFTYNSIRSTRGVIYDSLGNQIVFNKPSFNLIVNKKELPESESERENIFLQVAEIIGQSMDDIKGKIKKGETNTILISENLDREKLILIETKIMNFNGFDIEQSAVREYADGDKYAHIIGYTAVATKEDISNNPNTYSNSDYVGRIGLEKAYEDVLRKNPGKIRIERDAFGNEISKEIISQPESGKSLVLWLNSELQKKLYDELNKTLERIGSKKAVAVALDPKTGGVLSLISIPSFNNNLFIKGSDQKALSNLLNNVEEPLFNRAISGKYPTGSTIKPLISAAALQENIISASKEINCQGAITIPHRYNPEIIYRINDWTTHGPTDMRKAIAESCNVYFFTIGGGYGSQKGLGPTRIKKYLDLFGWEDKTGIDLPNEVSGFVPSIDWKKEYKNEGWWDGDTYNLSIGQGDIGITPIEVAASFTAIANGGTLYKPKIVKQIVDSEKNLVEEIRPEIIRENFIDPEYLKVVREGMRMGVTGIGAPVASSVFLNSLPVATAAKTGTAQVPKAGYYNNWITVFAPYDDPQIVLTIMIEEVENVQAAVLPIAKEVLGWYFSK
ncbi:MAG: penicillin-binding protein 2 [Candidatus Pacebacteria bacterium]|nr:penicillin-binding protein 2 [Candidatus Paceibacterota bacterium]